MVIALLFVLLSCAPKTNPSPAFIWDHYGGEGKSQGLFVFLPGRGARAEDFQKEGFVGLLREAGLPVDIVLADLHFGYFMEQSVVPILERDVIEKAEASGYKRIWLVGVSSGGMGAIFHNIYHGSRIEGLVLVAPWLGGRNRLPRS